MGEIEGLGECRHLPAPVFNPTRCGKCGATLREPSDARTRERPTVVTLCGSTRFKDEFERAARDETLAGRIVLTVGMFGHREGLDMAGPVKAGLDELHLRKIDISDEILVLNVGGYVGESTRREIAYAERTGKAIRYLAPPPAPLETLAGIGMLDTPEGIPGTERGQAWTRERPTVPGWYWYYDVVMKVGPDLEYIDLNGRWLEDPDYRFIGPIAPPPAPGGEPPAPPGLETEQEWDDRRNRSGEGGKDG